MTAPAGPVAGRIYLVGFMGAGKTTAGRLLAGRVGVPFVDLDRTLEEMAGCSVRQAFETHGEAWFREREAELLRGTAALPAAVVALGGGTFTFEANRDWVLAHGTSVFLDVPFGVVERRLTGKSADRPLFRSGDEARVLWEARRPWYTMATLSVPVSADDSPEDVVEALARALGLDPSGGEGFL